MKRGSACLLPFIAEDCTAPTTTTSIPKSTIVAFSTDSYLLFPSSRIATKGFISSKGTNHAEEIRIFYTIRILWRIWCGQIYITSVHDQIVSCPPDVTNRPCNVMVQSESSIWNEIKEYWSVENILLVTLIWSEALETGSEMTSPEGPDWRRWWACNLNIIGVVLEIRE